MKYRWTVTSRGLLLVAFPLLCQLLFVFTLCLLLWRVQADLSKEFHSKDTITEAYSIGTELIEIAGLSCADEKVVDENMLRNSADQASEKLRHFTRTLEKDPAQVQNVSNLNSAVSRMMLLSKQCHQAQVANAPKIRELFAQENIAARQVSDAVSALIATERERTNASPSRVRTAREHIVYVLLGAVALSIVLALVLGYLYSTAIRRPLARIRENSRLLAERKPLLPVLVGSDELSELDRVLHHAANDVNTALAKERALVDYAADLICSLDSQGKFMAVNPFVRRMLGYEPEQLVGRSLRELVSPADTARADELLKSVLKEGETRTVELMLRTKNGTIIDTKWSFLWSAVEQLFFCVVHDVTEQKRIEDLKQDFVNMVTHDLRSPLTSLFGSLKLIAVGAKGPVPPAVEAEINVAANNVSKLVLFVNDLLDFQKLRVGKMQINIAMCDLEEIIVESISFVQAVADSKRVEMRVQGGHWRIRCDKPKILQTLTNLISNALKFTPEGGTVSIEIAEFPHAVQVSVVDSGPGVPEQFREKIFEAFEQTPGEKTNVQGTGLGLAICKLIVEAHGGTIGVSANVTNRKLGDHGSTFWFRVPK